MGSGLEVNVTSMMLMVKFAVGAMRANAPREDEGYIRGSIVDMGSVAGLQGGKDEGNCDISCSDGSSNCNCKYSLSISSFCRPSL